MANAITTDPTAAVAPAPQVAAPKIAPGAGAVFAAGTASAANAAATGAPPQAQAAVASVSVDLSPAAHFLASVASDHDQLGQLEATAIDTPTLQRAVDTLAAQQAQPDEPPQLNANPALAAAIAAYRIGEQAGAPASPRSQQARRNLITAVDALTPEDALESETDASVLKGQQRPPLR